MSVQSELDALKANLAAMDAAIAAAGGTPSSTGTSGGAAAIATIPKGGEETDYTQTDWGAARHFSVYSEGVYVSRCSDEFAVIDINSAKFSEFLATKGVSSFSTSASCQVYAFSESNIQMNYDDWNTGASFYVSYTSYAEMAEATGIEIKSISSGADFSLKYGYMVDTTSPLVYTEILSQNEYNSFGNSAGSDQYAVTCGGKQVPISAIVEFIGGQNETTTPDKFLSRCPRLAKVILPPNLTSIGTNFMSQVSDFNGDITVPSGVTSIGNEFMFNLFGTCSINIYLPEGLTTIGNNFCGLSRFDGVLTLPSTVTSIGTGFLNQCSLFNHPLNIPKGLLTIPDSFMQQCSSFNQPLFLENVQSIGNKFLSKTAFNQPITTGATSIGDEFLNGCSVFNKSVNVSKASTIGDKFLYDCSAFNSPINIDSVTTIGKYFLTGAKAFNQPLTLPETLTTIGFGFLYMYGNPGGSFNQDLKLPSSLTKISKGDERHAYFMCNQGNMTKTIDVGSLAPTIVEYNASYAKYAFLCGYRSTDASYTTGIKIKGSNRAAWMTTFPNSAESGCYRNFIDAGE